MNSSWPFPVRIIRSKRRKKTITIQVHVDAVLVQAPMAASEREIEQIIRKRQRWIEDAFHRLERQQKQQPTPCLPRVFLLYGKPLKITYQYRAKSHWGCTTTEESFVIVGPESSLPPDVQRRLLVTYFKDAAKFDFSKRLSVWSHRMGLSFQTFRVRDQKTRWGSCSNKGNINLNWRLIQAPSEVIDYVVVHELCHLKEMNHSPRFWSLVEQTLPHYQESKAWLKKHGKSLFF